jgi:hypothetical protein
MQAGDVYNACINVNCNATRYRGSNEHDNNNNNMSMMMISEMSMHGVSLDEAYLEAYKHRVVPGVGGVQRGTG